MAAASEGAWFPGCGRPWTRMAGRGRFSSVDACEREAWTFACWPADRAAPATVAPLLCGNWRCRRCAKWRGAQDWSRVSEAVTSRPWWLYMVLTFDPAGWSGKWDAYRGAGAAWDHGMRRSIERRAGRLVYVQTWERHRNGWPHVNVLLSGEQLREDVEAAGVETRRHGKTGRPCRFSPAWRQWARAKALRAGFGGSIWCEVIDHTSGSEAMANYLLKLAAELTGAASKKGGQAPIDAPRHFRRIRASRGLLGKADPPAEKWAGAVLASNYGKRLREETTGEVDPGPRRTGERPGIQVPLELVDRWIAAAAKAKAAAWCTGLNPAALSARLDPESTYPIGQAFADARALDSLRHGQTDPH